MITKKKKSFIKYNNINDLLHTNELHEHDTTLGYNNRYIKMHIYETFIVSYTLLCWEKLMDALRVFIEKFFIKIYIGKKKKLIL